MNDLHSIEKTLNIASTPIQKRRKLLLYIGIITVLIVAATLYTIRQQHTNQPVYVTVPLRVQDLTTSVSATGNLEPTNTVDVGIEVSGTIERVDVDYNDRVRKNQLLAKLDITRLTATATSSKAAWMRFKANEESAKAALETAQIEYERAQKMYASTEGNYPSAKELRSLLTTLNQSRAALAAAKAQVEQSLAQSKSDADNLRKAVVVSPIDGIVLARKVEPGQTVVASMQTPVLFTLAEDLTKMKAIVSVDEADIGSVQEGQKVLFTVDAYSNRTFEGRITQLRLNSAIINGVVTYEAVVEVDNTALLLRPGMTASASIITETLKHVTVVPNAALRFTPPSPVDGDPQEKKKHATKNNDKAHHVWVLRHNTPVKINVSIGKSDGISTVVLDGKLKPTDRIITGIEEKQ